MLRLSRFASWIVAGSWLALASCGSATGASPNTAAGSAGEPVSAGEPGEPRGEDEASREPTAELCRDETCFRCGRGLCPAGFYCDESAPGGAGCAWLPECAAEASCACLAGRLGSGCSCEPDAGHARVTCK
ncbi:MAG: hypothetical protein OZ921_01365 [Sorangiineae bacterium]|nr:hypothetical protein [Polyangiaceae bacterium]MEB2321133.1 hypothetical protein [Sorangiineae bacterium]